MSNGQLSVVEWQPWAGKPHRTIFTVYRTANAIEVHEGGDRIADARLISSYTSYELAWEFAEILASQSNLPLQNFTTLSV